MTRGRYGVDAPTVTRNLAVAGGACLIGAALHPFRHALLAMGAALPIGALWILVSSPWLKMRVRGRLLESRRWTGDERVPDVGCAAGWLR